MNMNNIYETEPKYIYDIYETEPKYIYDIYETEPKYIYGKMDYNNYKYAICKCEVDNRYALEIPKKYNIFKCKKCKLEGFIM